MEIIKEHSRNLLLFLVPTIIITIILFIVLGATITLIIGFIILMIWSTIMYYFGVNRSLKNKKPDMISIILYIVPTIIISVIIFGMEDLTDPSSWISVIGLGVLLSTFCYSFYSKMHDVVA